MAITICPTFKAFESPRVAILIEESVSFERSAIFTEITARSELESAPFTVASAVVLSLKVTVIFWFLAPFSAAITWLFVTIRISSLFCPIIIPEPLPPLCCPAILLPQ